ncbi:hypothetical protein CE11_00649 [Megavirus courdo11]|nr:hypothetical protein QKC54_gp0571 [Megavirus baoshan]AEX61779.1 hypothetical protein c7_R716 [Megavirus courdo7]AFX92675.1 hypothetical protein CE11_00649 [Megavirus courdo11]AGD92534.1 hypothetical protein LBA_00616 [Megavirus lba]UFX99817.1 hypothetical protein Mb0501 [Megavirus baoshan]
MTSILENKVVIILISMIWGFGLALFFRKTCQNDQCVIVKAPPIFDQSSGAIYDNKTNKCYVLQKYPSSCTY